MASKVSFFPYWRASLRHSLSWYEKLRASTSYFYPKLFFVFVAINLACFWWALLTAFPGHLASAKVNEHILIGFPVSFLGAVFDSLSLMVTVYAIRRALISDSNAVYLGFLSIDLVIAVIASFWVLFAFVVSGWMVSFVLDIPETMTSRTALYQGRLASLLNDPFGAENLKNMYFGVIMGASALLPTLFHVSLAIKSSAVAVWVTMRPTKIQLVTGGDELDGRSSATKNGAAKHTDVGD